MAKTVKARVKNVPDGFTMSATYAPERASDYAGVRISYRPALQDEASAFVGDARPYAARARELVARHVLSWNVEGDEPGVPAPVTPEVVAELPYPVLDWITNVVIGYAARNEAADAKN